MNVFKVKELRNDFIAGLVAGLVFITVIYFFKLNFIFDNLLSSLEPILTISVTLSGFLITSLTILLVFPENTRIKFLKSHPTYKDIFHAFILSIVLFMSVAILTFSFKILIPYTPYILLALLLIIFIWAIISLFRCIWLLKKMIDLYFLDPEGKHNENSET